MDADFPGESDDRIIAAGFFGETENTGWPVIKRCRNREGNGKFTGKNIAWLGVIKLRRQIVTVNGNGIYRRQIIEPIMRLDQLPERI